MAAKVPMTTSAAGRRAIAAREGCRLEAYRDSVGVWTVGVGHTARAGAPTPRPGLRLTAAEAEAIFARDLAPFEAAVRKAVRAPLGQDQFDACVSLAFNIGSAAFARSSVARAIRCGDFAAAADAFLLWDRPPGLAQRRLAERDQFLRSARPASAPSRRAAPRRSWLASLSRHEPG